MSWLLSFCHRKPRFLGRARTLDGIHTPAYFSNWEAVEAFWDRLLEELRAKRMTCRQYRRRVRKLCAAYKKEAFWRAYDADRARERQEKTANG